MDVYVRSGGDVPACVMGASSGTRLARYTSASGQFAYAVALSDEAQYTKVSGLCVGLSWCAYGAETDTLLLQMPVVQHHYGHAIIRNFSQYLQLHSLPEPHYSFEYTQAFEAVGAGTRPLPTGSVAVSANGRWAVVELIKYGFIRIDMRDGSYRRVVSPGAEYGVGTDPSFELAVSNDGRFMAITGWRAGIDVYEMDGDCGDALSEDSTIFARAGTVPCKMANIERQALFPGFYSAHRPRFSGDGLKLSLSIATTSGYINTTVSPINRAPTSNALYVALGDSFVSGEGETDDAMYILGTNNATNRCHVSGRSYPYLLHSVLPMDALNQSCSGARSVGVRGQVANLPTANAAQVPTVISIGVGGNDINVMGKLKACIMPDTCEWALPENRIKTALEIKSIYPKLVRLFEEIQGAHPQATLFVVGYPKVIVSGDTSNCRFPLSAMLNGDEREYMNQTVGYLNVVLRQAAQYAGLQFIDVAEALNGERLCDTKETAMNAIRSGDDFGLVTPLGSVKMIGAESFHPTPRGHVLVARKILEVLSHEGVGAYCLQCHFAPVALTPPSYWYLHDNRTGQSLPVSGQFIVADSTGFGESLPFSFPPGSFTPHDEVRIEVRSTAVPLGLYTAKEDGSLTGVLTLPNVGVGYHTLHAMGRTSSGIEVDRYQVLYVGGKREVLESNTSQTVTPERRHIAAPLTAGPPAIAKPLTVLGAQVKQTGKETGMSGERPGATVYIWLVVGGAFVIFMVVAAYSIGRRQV